MGNEHDARRELFEKDCGTLDERLAGALAKLALATRHELRQQAADRGLSAVQAQVLAILSREAAAQIGTLAARLALTPATVSDSVAALEKRGLVRRRRVAHDRRGVQVTATARGKRLGQALALWPELFSEGIARLSDAEKRVFFRVLSQMILSLLQRGVIQEARMCLTCTYFRPDVHDDEERPHHCALVDVPLGPATLRIDCPDHESGNSPEAVLGNLDVWWRVTS